ncbi:MAG: PEP-CTERM sorting domain-containing protein, partial [Planctomycetes bacterium]|nr:PEP-CTERM sorting domain-containing protein [Planctomycetota bacterium]
PRELNGIQTQVFGAIDVTGLLGSANVTIVPEPTTVLLFGLGVGGLACVGRWTRRNIRQCHR